VSHDCFGPVLVTGASRRIGLAIAQHFALKGRDVILHASPRTFEDAELACRELRLKGASAQVLVADIEQLDDANSLIAKATNIFGPMDLLVNNASIFEVDTADNFHVDLYEKHMAINLRGPIIFSRDFVHSLPQGRHGSIVNIIDQKVTRLNPRYFSYTLSKAALWTATQTMAQAFAPRVRVNAVGPGPVFPNAALSGHEFDHEVRGIPLAQPVSVLSIVEAVDYLSNAHSVTGQMIAVDGGQHLAWRTPDIV